MFRAVRYTGHGMPPTPAIPRRWGGSFVVCGLQWRRWLFSLSTLVSCLSSLEAPLRDISRLADQCGE
jgi:hypothetical protein